MPFGVINDDDVMMVGLIACFANYILFYTFY